MPVATKRSRGPRERLAGCRAPFVLRRTSTRSSRNERHILYSRHRLEATPHRQPQRERYLSVDLAQSVRRRRAAVVMLEYPVPCEIAESDRRNAGCRGGGDAERRQIRHREDGAVFTKELHLVRNARVERRHERLGTRDRILAHRDAAVQLDDPGIHFDRRQFHSGSRRSRDQPWSHRGSDDDVEIRTTIDQRVDDFDRAGSVAEAMAGNVENDRPTVVQRTVLGWFYVTGSLPRHPFVGRVKRAGNLPRSIGDAGGCSASIWSALRPSAGLRADR